MTLTTRRTVLDMICVWALLGAACIVPTPTPKPTPPPAVRHVRAAVIAAGVFLDAGTVQLDVDPPFGSQSCALVHGQVDCILAGNVTPPYGAHLRVSADGFDSYAVDFVLASSAVQFVPSADDPPNIGNPKPQTLIQSKPKHRDPASFSDADVRAIRANLSGIYLDEIKPQCPVDPRTGIRCVADNGATPRGLGAGAFFSANYRMYTDDQRKVIRDVWTGQRPDSRGVWHRYTHMAVSLFCVGSPDYHGVYPPCASSAKIGLNDALRELYDNEPPIIPDGFVMQDDEPNDLTTPLSIAGTVDPSLLRIVVPYWEHFEVSCATVKVHRAFPNALIYYHNPNGTDAPYGDDCYPGRGAAYPGAGAVYSWLRANTDGRFVGVQLQTEEADLDSLRGRIADFLASFSNGPRVGRVGAGWPSGLDVVWFEDLESVYNNFWGGGDEAALQRRVNAIDQHVRVPLCEDGNTRAVVPSSQWCGTLAGFGSGGSVQ